MGHLEYGLWGRSAKRNFNVGANSLGEGHTARSVMSISCSVVAIVDLDVFEIVPE
jgi:hypothetical protein